MTGNRARIEHMLQSIERIQDAMKDVSEEDFFQSRILLDAMSFNFAILGEAANKVSDRLHRTTRKFRGETSSGCGTF